MTGRQTRKQADSRTRLPKGQTSIQTKMQGMTYKEVRMHAGWQTDRLNETEDSTEAELV